MEPNTTRTITTNAEFQAMLDSAPAAATYNRRFRSGLPQAVPKPVLRAWARMHYTNKGGALAVRIQARGKSPLYTIEVP